MNLGNLIASLFYSRPGRSVSLHTNLTVYSTNSPRRLLRSYVAIACQLM